MKRMLFFAAFFLGLTISCGPLGGFPSAHREIGPRRYFIRIEENTKTWAEYWAKEYAKGHCHDFIIEEEKYTALPWEVGNAKGTNWEYSIIISCP